MYVSSAQMNHGWNIVTIDGERYHLDVTWNDPIPDQVGRLRYQYFNLSDEAMTADHVWDTGGYPSCSSDRFNYLRSLNQYDVKRYRKYFYYNDGKLVKQKFDGTEIVKSNFWITNLSLNGSLLSYQNLNTGKMMTYDLKFDLSEDGQLSIEDLEMLIPFYNQESLFYDLNDDEIIDLYDVVLLSQRLK